VSWMIHNAFLSIASVAAILASVALLVVLSALTLGTVAYVQTTLCSAVRDLPGRHLGWGGFYHLPNQAHHSMNPESRANFGDNPFYELR
jgi:sterol desaturase/sphingolipid hydroxylase (fatty acid hydroxylase superfamily)